MNDTAYLLIHGFAGGTDEVLHLHNYLLNKGLFVSMAKIAGHGGTRHALSKSSPQDWYDSVRNCILELEKSHNRIVVIGFSMGGLMAAYFAHLHSVRAVVMINTPVYFWNLGIIFSDIADGLATSQYDKIDFYKKSASTASAKSCLDFLSVLAKSKKIFKTVSKPALVLQCKRDESVHYKSAHYIKYQIGDHAKLRFYDGGCHQILLKPSAIRDSICSDIYCFIASLRGF